MLIMIMMHLEADGFQLFRADGALGSSRSSTSDSMETDAVVDGWGSPGDELGIMRKC
jgi:hypothetical protein